MNKTPVIYFTCGIPGSGKSTWCENNKDKLNAVVHSSDSIREELLENINDQSQNELVFTTLHKRVKEDLLNGKNIMLDATNLKRKNRLHFLRYIQNIPCKKVCVLFATPLDVCKNNNASREHKIPEDVIERMVRTYECPAYAEQWDEIQIVWYDWEKDGMGFNLGDALKQWCLISHDSPFHKFTIGNHMGAAYLHYINDCEISEDHSEEDVVLSISILLHDCGKPYCKQFLDNKGNPSEIAHYYGHEHYGAYLSLFYLKEAGFTDNDMLRVSLLIELHMKPYLSWKQSDKAKEKDRKLFGNDIIDDVMLINKYDKTAH